MPSTGGETSVLGVVEQDAVPATVSPAGSTPYGLPVVDMSVPLPQVAVGWHEVYNLLYADAASLGELLVAASDGRVTPYTEDVSTLGQIVARCVEPGEVRRPVSRFHGSL